MFEFGTAPWPDGASVLQVYLPVDLALEANRELAGLISQWLAAVRDAPVVPVADDHLHVTLDVVADRVAEEIPDAERAELATALRHRLHDWPTYRGTADSALAYPSEVAA